MGMLLSNFHNIHAIDSLQFKDYSELSTHIWVKKAHTCEVLAPECS
jgi:hypothetical protein